MISHPLIHPPGVYFGLDENIYHAALALSATGIKWLRVSTLDWWVRSPLNPAPQPDEPTEAMGIGKAFHKRILEGREAFAASYAPALDPADYPHVLRTNEQLIDAIVRAGGIASKAKRKSELITLLEYHDPKVVVWERFVAAHERHHEGKTLLSAELMRRIEVAAAMIEKHPTLSKAFTGGVAEASIFWRDTETGIPCKARLDYLKPHAIVDLKTFQNNYQMPIDVAVMRSIANYRYHIQAAWYLDAAKNLPLVLNRYAPTPDYPEFPYSGVHDDEYGNFVDQLCANGDKTWLWVFQQQGIAPVARGYILGPGTLLDIARQEIEQAKALWLHCWNTYGSDPWVDQAEIREVDPTEVPAYIAT